MSDMKWTQIGNDWLCGAYHLKALPLRANRPQTYELTWGNTLIDPNIGKTEGYALALWHDQQQSND